MIPGLPRAPSPRIILVRLLFALAMVCLDVDELMLRAHHALFKAAEALFAAEIRARR